MYILWLALGMAIPSACGQALKATSTSRIYAASTQTFVQDMSAASDGVWFLIRNSATRTVTVKKVFWDGSVTTVREGLPYEYVGIATDDGQDVYLTRIDGTIEQYGPGMSMRTAWKLPYGTPYQAIAGGRLITARDEGFAATSLRDKRSLRRSVFLPEDLGPMTNLERLDENSVLLFSAVTGRFLKLGVPEGGIEEGEIPSGLLSFRTEWAASRKTSPDGEPIRMTVAAFATNRSGELLVVPNPVTPSNTKLLQLSASGQLLRQFALDLDFPDATQRMHVHAMAMQSRKLIVISAHGLAKLFSLPN